MKEIIARSEIPELRKQCPGYRVKVVESHDIEGFPSAIVMYKPEIEEIIDEVNMISSGSCNARLVIIAERYRRVLLEALFPSAVVIDSIQEFNPETLRYCEKKKKIRFTDNEKRTLSELPYGLTAKELAVRLGVSERSVRRTKSNLLRKTGLLSSGQLMVYALLSRRISTRSSSHTLDTE